MKEKFTLHQSKFPDIKISNQFIYIKTEHANGNKTHDNSMWKLWVPNRLRNEVFLQAHNTVISSHCGMHKTIEKLRINFFWPGLANDVRNYIRNCDTCKEIKAPNYVLRPPVGLQSVTCRPFQRIYIALLGPYPRSKIGHVGLLITNYSLC